MNIAAVPRTPTTPEQQFVEFATKAGERSVAAALSSHVLEDYVGPGFAAPRRAIEDATQALDLLNKALDLGYISDDAGSFAGYAIEQLQAGVDKLTPILPIHRDHKHEDQVSAALAAAKQHFLNANGWAAEAVDAV